MGREVVNGGLEPVVSPNGMMFGLFAGSALTRHAASPDEAPIDTNAARALCRRAAEVDVDAFGMAIPPVWRQTWDGMDMGERAAVWRGCRALWALMTGPRW